MYKIKKMLAIGLVCLLCENYFTVLQCKHDTEDAEIVDLNQEAGIELLKAANSGDVRKVEELLDAGVPVDFKNGDDETALHYASNGGFLDVAASLIKSGANVNVLDRFKETPLFRSVCANKYEMTWFLLKNGADVSLQNNHSEDVLYCVTKDNALETDYKILALLYVYLLKHYAGAPFRFCGKMIRLAS